MPPVKRVFDGKARYETSESYRVKSALERLRHLTGRLLAAVTEAPYEAERQHPTQDQAKNGVGNGAKSELAIAPAFSRGAGRPVSRNETSTNPERVPLPAPRSGNSGS